LENLNDYIIPFDSDSILKNSTIDSIKGQITLIENPEYVSIGNYPVKLDVVIAIICHEGTMTGTLNLKKFTASSPCLFIVLPGQILQSEYFSDDFKGLTIILSKEFWDGFPFDNSMAFPLFRSIQENPCIRLKQEELDSMTNFFHLMQKTIRKQENQNRSEAVKYLTIAFFYGFGYQYHQIPEDLNKSKQDKLVEKFLRFVREDYRKHREVEYYAEKICLTPKYLSKVLKQKSGKTAADWIEDHVILEAKALLKSTNKTVLQISDELNFPSQSFFGKYFKRRVGMSPREYQKAL